MREVLCSIYEPESMTAEDVYIMKNSICDWENAIGLEKEKLAKVQAADIRVFGRVIITEHKYYEEELALQAAAKMISDNESGALDDRKALFKEHGIDWKKFHRLPDAYAPKDFHKGQLALAEAKKGNPEDYL